MKYLKQWTHPICEDCEEGIHVGLRLFDIPDIGNGSIVLCENCLKDRRELALGDEDDPDRCTNCGRELEYDEEWFYHIGKDKWCEECADNYFEEVTDD